MAAKYAGVPPTTSDFEKIGDAGYEQVMNMSGQRSPYTMPQARRGPTSPDQGGGNGSARRSPSLIHGAQGPTFRPVATKVQGSEYPETGRALRTVPSAVGTRPFWDQRQEGQVIG